MEVGRHTETGSVMQQYLGHSPALFWLDEFFERTDPQR